MLFLVAQLLQQIAKAIGNLFGGILFIDAPQVLIDLLFDRGFMAILALGFHTFVYPGNLVYTVTNL